MPGEAFSVPGYRLKIANTEKRVLLVEGQDDKSAFRCLLDEARNMGLSSASEIVIDTAAMIRTDDGLERGSREIVEMVCSDSESNEALNRLVGFVDREFREFDADCLLDRVGSHYASGRIVWSRGHSIENYFFDVQLLRQVIRSISLTESFDEAMTLFERVFQSGLTVSCCLSLAAYRLKKIGLVRGSLGWNIFRANNSGVELDNDGWVDAIVRKLSATREMADSLSNEYEYWHERLADADPDVVRWMVHGHLCFEAIWAIYARCVYEVSQDQQESERVLRAGTDIRFNRCADAWASRSLSGDCCFPEVVLRRLGFRIETD